MIYKKCVILLFILPLLTSCLSRPEPGPQFTRQHYTFNILLIPEALTSSPRLEIALSLLQVNYSEKQAEFLYRLLYSAGSLDEYKDRVINLQRAKARQNISGYSAFGGEGLPNFHWRFVERFNITAHQNNIIIIERAIETYIGGSHSLENKRYYIVDLENLYQIKTDDLFSDFQGDLVRSYVYSELRNYSNLEPDQPLSEGIYFSDEPELSFNYNITRFGIGLHWDPTEIAPYEEGCIEVIIPWTYVHRMMLRSGLDVLNKLGISH